MRFLIDTNIASAYLRGHAGVANRFMQHTGGLCISSIAVGELYSWAMRQKNRGARMGDLESMLEDFTELAVDHDVAELFGRVRASLLDVGRPVPTPDLFIACTALHHDLTMVSANRKDFEMVPGLRLQNWPE